MKVLGARAMRVSSALRRRCRAARDALLALLCGGLACACESKSKAEKAEEAVPVTLASVQVLDVPREVKAFGTVEASSSVDVRSQVQGLITDVHFHEGDFVKHGQLLFTIDTRPYSATLAAAQAELLRSRALAEQARVEAERAARLRLEGVASDQEVNKALADARSSAANVQVGQAQIAGASLNVALTRINSPFDGRTGSLLVHAGNIVKATDLQPLVVIRALSPIYVRFSVPQDYLGAIREHWGQEPPLKGGSRCAAKAEKPSKRRSLFWRTPSTSRPAPSP
jgi:multidrug efflux system membrane fusion protein